MDPGRVSEYNSLLQDDLKLSDDVLISRCLKFGEVPRFVFIKSEELNTEDLDHAIASRNALKVISYAKSKSAVREDNYSHRVLQMVPSKTDFRTKFYFDFLSNHIAETIIDQLDQEILQKVSEFAVAHDGDDSGSTSVLRGKIYALLCHKWFSLPKQHNLMTRNRDHGAPLNACIKWLEGVCIATDRLYFSFVVPNHLVHEFKKQSIGASSNSESKRPGPTAKVNQFITTLNVIGERGQYCNNPGLEDHVCRWSKW
ncbi:hypothetical protein L915_03695 [Phytophthora nicotianae]|uniref:Uncharacterized protein n=1 Tax=Phytophthora nicotianae TaxID=4792 RepID=W2HCQ6_PHYNI|nr:hypothetical protein L915_03695 [Phytophthora nicotianae]